jgi:hypothetical protein
MDSRRTGSIRMSDLPAPINVSHFQNIVTLTPAENSQIVLLVTVELVGEMLISNMHHAIEEEHLKSVLESLKKHLDRAIENVTNG